MFAVQPDWRFSDRTITFATLLMLSVYCVSAAAPAAGATLGLVSDNVTKRVSLFDADRDTVSASLQADPGKATGDCALTSDASVGFSSSSSSQITFLEISGDSGLSAMHRSLVPISNLGVDMSLSPDDAFLVMAGGGALQQPLAVIDTGLRAEVATARPFADHTSVEFCDNGTLLVTTTHGKYFNEDLDNALYDADLDQRGNISLRGHRVSSGAQPNNSACAPGSLAAVMLDREGGLTSFTLPELEVADRETTRQRTPAVAAVFSRDGRRLYVLTSGTVEAFDFDPVSGEMTPDWVRNAPGSLNYYGMDQIALHPHADKLYVHASQSILVLDPTNGASAGSMPIGGSTGICFANAPQIPGDGRYALQSRPAAP